MEFGLKHYEQEGRLPQWLGWTADSDDLRAYLRIMQKSFTRSDRLQAALVNLSGGNARRALELMTTFVNSPHSEADLTLERNDGPTDYLVPPHAFLKAALLGDAEHYDPGTSRIPNLFSISTDDIREHFLLPCLLGLLLRRASEQADGEGYMPIDEVFSSFQDAGFDVEQVRFALRRADHGDFLETLPPDAEARFARVTTVGAYAHQTLAAEFQYLDVVVVDTPVSDPSVRARLRVVHAIRQRLERAETFLSYLDKAWVDSDLGVLGLFDWPASAGRARIQIDYIQGRL